MEPMIGPSSSIPELIKFIKHSFRECEFDEVQGILLEREKRVKIEMENLVTDRDELKKEVDSLENSKGYTELEKCELEEKLRRNKRRGVELDKTILEMKKKYEKLLSDNLEIEEKLRRSERRGEEWDEMNEKFDKLRSEKADVEEKLARSTEKLGEMDERMVEMGKEIEELRREKLSASKTIEELKAKEIEVHRVAQELKRENAEALQTIEELRVKKMKSDKAVGFYKNDLDPRISKLERAVAKMLSVNVEDLASLANGQRFSAEAQVEEDLRNREVNLEEEDRAIVLREVPAVSGSHASVVQSGGEVPTQKAAPSSPAAGNVVIVIDDSESDDETSIPDTSPGQRNKEDRTDSREDSLMNLTKRRKISTSATPSHCSSLPRRVEERTDALQQPSTVDYLDSIDSDDELISDDHMNNLVATCQSKVGSKKG